MRATAIIPVKRFGAAKKRLLDELDRPRRAALVKAMLSDVLAATMRAALVERVIVVTGEGRAERIALRRARRGTVTLEVLRDPKDLGHSEAATLGIVRAKALGASCVVLLPGDCPLLDPADLDAALERMRDRRVAVVPDRHGTGTNALLLAPPDAIGPAFGPLSSLGLDVDTPADLAALSAALEREPGIAPATAAELNQPETAGRRSI